MTEQKIQELLGLLELSVEDFMLWLYANKVIHHHPTDELRIESLPEMAFRLRDETKSLHFHDAIYQVQQWVFHHKDVKVNNWTTSYWGMAIAQPKHWIVASLIAKELKE